MPKVRNSPVWCLIPVHTVVVCPPVCSSSLQFYHINAYVYRKSMLSLSDSCSLERSPRLHLRRLKWLNFTFSVCVRGVADFWRMIFATHTRLMWLAVSFKFHTGQMPVSGINRWPCSLCLFLPSYIVSHRVGSSANLWWRPAILSN